MERRRQAQPPRYRGAEQILWRLIAAAALLLIPEQAALAQSPAVEVYARYDLRVAHIETIGTLYNGKEEVGGGSGILIGENLILTNNHVIPRENNYKELVINVRPETRERAPIKATLLGRDQGRDFALLKLAAPVTNAAGPGRCPMPVIKDAASVPVGASIYMISFPINEPQSLTPGTIKNKSSSNGRWGTNALINPGDSGGPAFDDDGALIGLAVGGVTTFTPPGGQPVNITGINFLIPSTRLRESPLFQQIAQLPADQSCWIDKEDLAGSVGLVPAALADSADGADTDMITSNEAASMPGNGARSITGGHHGPGGFLMDEGDSGGGVIVGNEVLKLPQNLNLVFNIAESAEGRTGAAPAGEAARSLASAKPLDIERSFNAEPGYRIKSCSLTAHSANLARDELCKVSGDGKSATFSVRLQETSDPGQDSGWWYGALRLQQERAR